MRRCPVILLGAVVLALAGCGGSGTSDATTLIDKFNAAASAKDGAAVARLLLTTDFDAWSNGETFGPTALVTAIATKSTLRLERDAPVVSTGGFEYTFAKTPSGRVMEVFQSQGGKLRRLWLIVPGRDVPFDIAAP